MLLKIFKYGEKVLREKARDVASVGEADVRLAEDMVETMHHAKGVGLAAQQVGRLERVCVIDIPDGCEEVEDAAFNAPIAMPLMMWNARIVDRQGSVCEKEGCLSFPGIGGKVVRAHQVTCTYFDASGQPQTITARGYLARAIQHETDHLDAILYIDRLSAVERLAQSAKLKRLAKANGSVR